MAFRLFSCLPLVSLGVLWVYYVHVSLLTLSESGVVGVKARVVGGPSGR